MVSGRMALAAACCVALLSIGSDLGATTIADWVQDGNLAGRRAYCGVALLDDGIFYFGGEWSPGNCLDTAYVYQPGGSNIAREDMPFARMNMGFVQHDGKVYSLGGYEPGSGVAGRTKNVLGYDPLADSWAEEQLLPTECEGSGGVSLDGYIYNIGGHHEISSTGGGFSLSRVDRYEPGSGDPWDPMSWPLNTPRSSLGIALVDGRIYAFGGANVDKQHGINEVLQSLEIYDPSVGSWVFGEEMPTARYRFATAVVGDRIYAIGGYTDHPEGTSFTAAVEFYDVSEGKWYTDRPLPVALAGARAMAIGDTIYVLGGLSSSGYSDIVYRSALPEPTTVGLLSLGLAALLLNRRKR